MSGTHAATYGVSGKPRERSGNYYPGVVPAGQFATADGHYLVVNCTTQRVFERLCTAIGEPGLVSDARFTPRRNLMHNHEAIHAILGAWIAARTLAECQAVFDGQGIPASKVYSTADIVADPHYHEREQVVSVETAGHGHVLQPGVVPRLTATPGRVPSRAPLLGEHNDEVYLGELGLDRSEYSALRESGVI